MWIKPGELIKVKVDGVIVKFKPVKRGERIKITTSFSKDSSPEKQIDTIYDFVIEHVVEVDGLKDSKLKEMIEWQTADKIGSLFTTIMEYGTLPKESAENLDSPSASSEQNTLTATAKPMSDAENSDASTNQNTSNSKKMALHTDN